jgi:hypothetical protein
MTDIMKSRGMTSDDGIAKILQKRKAKDQLVQLESITMQQCYTIY